MANLLNQARSIISTPPLAKGPGAGAAELDDELADEASASESRTLAVPATHHGDRLDRTLAALVPEFSRNYLSQLVEGGAAQVNGRAITKPAHKVRAADQVVIELRPTPMSQAFVPQAMPLAVVYEDEHLAVIDKPAGLVVHPAPGHWSGTLLNGLLARDDKARQLPRAGIVHRLDKDTSGLMVVAKSRQVMDALVAMIARRDVSRQYVALAHGAWRGGMREVRQAIGRDPRNRLRMAVVDLGSQAGKPAQTDITGVDSAEQACLVHCKLHTGRTHQIRVHMAWLGHPLLADALYGGTPLAGMERQALHAYRLGFVHPITGQEVLVRSTPPADFMAAIDFLGLRYNPPH